MKPTQGLTIVTYSYIEQIPDNELAEACRREPELNGGFNVMNGKVTCKGVAEALGMSVELTEIRKLTFRCCFPLAERLSHRGAKKTRGIACSPLTYSPFRGGITPS